MTAATDATGVSVFIDSLYESQAQRRARLSAPLQLQCSAKKRLVFSPHFRYNRKNQVIRYKDRGSIFMKHNRGGILIAVLLLVIAVAVAGIVYYVLRITQTGPATATGGVENRRVSKYSSRMAPPACPLRVPPGTPVFPKGR